MMAASRAAATPCLGALGKEAMTHRAIRVLTLALGVLGLTGRPTHADHVYKVGSGSGCTHRTLSAALAESRRHDDRDVIYLTRTANTQNTEVAFTGRVEIIGGYDNCRVNDPEGKTIVSGKSNGTRGIF